MNSFYDTLEKRIKKYLSDEHPMFKECKIGFYQGKYIDITFMANKGLSLANIHFAYEIQDEKIIVYPFCGSIHMESISFELFAIVLELLVAYAKQNGYRIVAGTEHHNIFGFQSYNMKNKIVDFLLLVGFTPSNEHLEEYNEYIRKKKTNGIDMDVSFKNNLFELNILNFNSQLSLVALFRNFIKQRKKEQPHEKLEYQICPIYQKYLLSIAVGKVELTLYFEEKNGNLIVMNDKMEVLKVGLGLLRCRA